MQFDKILTCCSWGDNIITSERYAELGGGGGGCIVFEGDQSVAMVGVGLWLRKSMLSDICDTEEQ